MIKAQSDAAGFLMALMFAGVSGPVLAQTQTAPEPGQTGDATDLLTTESENIERLPTGAGVAIEFDAPLATPGECHDVEVAVGEGITEDSYNPDAYDPYNYEKTDITLRFGLDLTNLDETVTEVTIRCVVCMEPCEYHEFGHSGGERDVGLLPGTYEITLLSG